MINKIYYYILFKVTYFKNLILEFFKYQFNKSKGIILIEGHGDSTNFGDALNYPFVEYLSRKKVILSKYLSKKTVEANATYSVIGSIIQMSSDNCIIWGAGFISNQKIKIPKPQKICAVRGPLSRKIFLENKIECPEVYGDPALLMPFMYNPSIEKKYDIGFFPHYVDKKSEFIKYYENNGAAFLIDVEIGQDYKGIINQMLSCKCIVTSSLHGLILSHSYNIPVLWVKYSDKITGGRFKYDDYLLSVNKQNINPLFINKHFEINEYVKLMDVEKIDFDYRSLLEACPFISGISKNEVLATIDKKERLH
ncbi:polysaccharide pyruvyl transferase family protein [Flavobacterium sp. XS2P12]|uniref:polysaccharide pyruvyl transferase family protein n=1 Tax=Flavobacterium melibiosi TaxID=3398734 RepID=UPI003A870297